MRISGWLVVIVAALVAAFAAVNWTAFTTPSTLSLVAFDVSAPLGAIMLAALVILTLLALAFAVSWRTSMLIESRRLSRELETQRQLADRAEASRVTELARRMDTVVQEVNTASEAIAQAVQDRTDRLEASLREAFRAEANSLTASLGELEDKVDKALAEPVART